MIKWIHPSQLRNFVIGCGSIDWFERFGHLHFQQPKPANKPDNLGSYLANQGHLFESHVTKWISKSMEPSDYISICKHRDDVYNEDKHIALQQAMDEKKKCIFQAPLRDSDKGFLGVADILIRNDVLYELGHRFNIRHDYPVTVGRDHYVVVDVKYTTFDFKRDGTLLSRPLWKYYACQVCMYNHMLGKIQGYKPDVALLWGRNFLERLAPIPGLSDTESETVTTMWAAVEHLSDLDNKSGLAPNDAIWELGYNRSIAKYSSWIPTISELYQEHVGRLWRLNQTAIGKAKERGIYSWKDNQCSAISLGMVEDSSVGKIVDRMIVANRDNTMYSSKFESPDSVLGNWKSSSDLYVQDIYVDFEVLGTAYDNFTQFPKPNTDAFVFQIGLGYFYKKWHYKSLIMDRKDKQSEKKIVAEFCRIINQLTLGGQPCRLWHWSGAERAFWKGIGERHADLAHIQKFHSMVQWCDMMALLQRNFFVMPGMFTFKLKEVARVFKERGLLDIYWDGGLQGEWIMIQAAQEYDNHKHLTGGFTADLKKYNEMDCKALWLILGWLRTNV